MPQSPQPQSKVRPARRRLHPLALAGLSLMFVVTPVMVVVAVLTREEWTYLAVLASFAVGLVTLGSVLTPGRTSYRGGTRIWQNDGLGGAGGGGAA